MAWRQAPPLLLTLALGCEPAVHDSEPSGGGDSGDSAGDTHTPDTDTQVDHDCTVPEDPDAIFGQIQLEPTAQATVFTVSWEGATDGDSGLGFGLPEGEEILVQPRAEDDGRVEALLVGLAPEHSYRWRVYRWQDQTLFCSPEATLETGALDPTLPTLTVSKHDASIASGAFTLLTATDELGSAGRWALIIDADGRIVWASQADGIRARLSLDRQAVLVNDRSYDPDTDGRVTRIPLDGSASSEVTIPGAHLDFVEVEPGVYASIGWDLRDFDDGARTLAGETIVEIDASGESREVWSIFDAMTPDLEQSWDSNPGWQTPAETWVHLNHLHYAHDEGAYYVTSRTQALALRVERASGETSWILGSSGSFSSDEPIRFNPHSAVPGPSGLVIFDTGSETTEGCSGVSEYSLDTDTWTAALVASYHTEDCLVCGYLGNATVEDNGNRTLVLSTNGQLDEATPDGQLAWRLNGPSGWTFAFATREGSLY